MVLGDAVCVCAVEEVCVSVKEKHTDLHKSSIVSERKTMLHSVY